MRPGPARLLLAGASLAMLAFYAAVWLQVTPLRERGSDFSASYVAGLVWRDGQGDRLYDQPLEASRHAAILPPGAHADLPFITPPLTAVLAAPFTLLDPETAFRVFSLLQLLLLATAVVVALRASPWPRDRPGSVAAGLLAVAGTATFPLLLLGQWDGVSALGLALAYAAWRRGHAGRAGLALAIGMGLAKPHLALGLALFVLGRRDLRALGGAVAGLAALVAATLVLAGPPALTGFASALGGAFGHTPPASTLGLYGLAASWLGDGAPARAVALVGGIAGLAACALLGVLSRRGPERLEATLAGAAALSLLVAVHLLGHDLTVLAPAFAWCCGAAAAAEGRFPGRAGCAIVLVWVGLSALVALDAGNGAPAPPGRIVPWGLIALGAAAVLVARRPRPASAEAVAAQA